jgi:hypothetical protein
MWEGAKGEKMPVAGGAGKGPGGFGGPVRRKDAAAGPGIDPQVRKPAHFAPSVQILPLGAFCRQPFEEILPHKAIRRA